MMTGHHSRQWVAVAVLAMFAMTVGVVAAPAAAVDQHNDEYPTTTCGGEWHWVHVQTVATSGTLTVEFEGAGVLEVLSSDSPSVNLHYSVVLRGGDTLVEASDDVGDGKLLLSHWPECDEPEHGSITVIKGTNPRTSAEFDFEISNLAGRTVPFTLKGMDDRGTSGVVENQRVFDQLPPDTYVIEELLGDLPRGYEFVDVVCEGGRYREDGAKVGIRLEAGDRYVCTFMNELEEEPDQGSITVVKRAPEGNVFDFQLRFGERLDTKTVEGGDDHTWAPLPDGTYQLTELVPRGWTLSEVRCDAPVEPIDDGVEITLPVEPAVRCPECEKVRDVTCVFTDVKDEPDYGSITVIKVTDPETESEFDFEISNVAGRTGSFSLAGMDDVSTSLEVENKRVFDRLPKDTYVIEELQGDLPGRYTLRNVSCTGGDYDVDEPAVSIELEVGDDYVCTFENRSRGGGNGGNGGNGGDRDGAIGDFVWFDTNGNGVQDDGEPPLEGVTVQLLDPPGKLILKSMQTDASGKYLFTGLDKGTYRVKFLLPDVYDNQTESFTKWAIGPFDKDSDADGNAAGMTSIIALSEGEVDLTWDAGVIAASVLAAVVQATTTTVAVAAVATLPFTGAATAGLGLLGLLLLATGGLALATSRARHTN